MSYRKDFANYIALRNEANSGKASSYLKALDLLSEIASVTPIEGCSDFWSVDSPQTIQRLYNFARGNQTKEQGVFLRGDIPKSYGQYRFYSAALRAYGQFLVTHLNDAKWMEVYQTPSLTGAEIASRLSKVNFEPEDMFTDGDSLDDLEGLDVRREVKTRKGHTQWAKIVRAEYRHQCCLTGLEIPQVLRASHIVGWAEDKKNRLNPENGLLLSATYDAAFDKHLISLDEDYRMIVSPVLRDHYNSESAKEFFLSKEGRAISRPTKYSPDQVLLQKHRDKLKR